MSAIVLKATLLEVEPEIWRRVRVPAAMTLRELHGVLQVAFDWSDRETHRFAVADSMYRPPHVDEPSAKDDRDVTLGAIARDHVNFEYVYEVGDDDGWRHTVAIESIESGGELACLAGELATPPEECGSAVIWRHCKRVIADHEHHFHEKTMAWVGPWDPHRCELDLINEKLRAHARGEERKPPATARRGRAPWAPIASDVEMEDLTPNFSYKRVHEIRVRAWRARARRGDAATVTLSANDVLQLIAALDTARSIASINDYTLRMIEWDGRRAVRGHLLGPSQRRRR